MKNGYILSLLVSLLSIALTLIATLVGGAPSVRWLPSALGWVSGCMFLFSAFLLLVTAAGSFWRYRR